MYIQKFAQGTSTADFSHCFLGNFLHASKERLHSRIIILPPDMLVLKYYLKLYENEECLSLSPRIEPWSETRNILVIIMIGSFRNKINYMVKTTEVK